jgi:glycosyltransferase involved in cell wall biosynthesis
VAPLRRARGIQNKILEAMAMEQPVVAATACAEALTDGTRSELLVAETAADHVRELDALLRSPARARAVGIAGRQRVLAEYGWEANLATLDLHLAEAIGAGGTGMPRGLRPPVLQGLAQGGVR